MRTKVKPGARIELEHAKENSQVINSYSAVAKFPLIVDTTDIYYMSKEARDFLSLRGRESVVNSIAIIRKSLIGNMIANFYIGLNKPTVPTRLFTNEEEAIKWCEKYKETINAV